MELSEALQKALKSDKRTRDDPFLLMSRVCDLVGNDYQAKRAAESFYYLDSEYGITKAIRSAVPARGRKKHYYKLKPMPTPSDNSLVYHSAGSETLHLSAECPCLKKSASFFEDTYKWAQYRQEYARRGTKKRTAKKHKPTICRYCGNFTPRRARGFIRCLSLFLGDMFHRAPDERLIIPGTNDWI